jgi:hypothetical protein
MTDRTLPPIHMYSDTDYFSAQLSTSTMDGSGGEVNQSYPPSIFTFKPKTTALLIHITLKNAQNEVIGQAHANLATISSFTLWKEQSGNSGRCCIPIMQSMTCIGEFWFEFVHILPCLSTFKGDYIYPYRNEPLVVGHRGMGMNKPVVDRSKLQLGENTVPSFTKTVDFNADAVEFDVQLTKDGIPVIYHDCKCKSDS